MPATDYTAQLRRYGATALRKARAAVQQRRVDGEGVRWWVVNEQGQARWLHLITDGHGQVWVTCTCANGRVRGGTPTCWHSAAVLACAEAAEPGPVGRVICGALAPRLGTWTTSWVCVRRSGHDVGQHYFVASDRLDEDWVTGVPR